MAKKDPIDQFAEDLMQLIKKHKPKSLIVMMGMPKGNESSHACFISGETNALNDLLDVSIKSNPEFHKLIDDIAGEHVEIVEVARPLPMIGRKVD